jgi:hypothetical protein
MKIESLPVEILYQIFNYLPVFNLETISYANKYLHNLIKNVSFGKRYLALQANELSFAVKIKMESTGLDRIAIGHTGPNRVIIVSLPDITQIKVTLTGRIYIHQFKTDLTCSFSKHENCEFCTKFGILKYEPLIDKQYRIFFQTWKDDVFIRLSSGIQLHLCLEHEDLGIGWDVPKPIPEFQVYRYGLFVPFYYTCFLENLWGLRRGKGSPVRAVEVYNPWG